MNNCKLCNEKTNNNELCIKCYYEINSEVNKLTYIDEHIEKPKINDEYINACNEMCNEIESEDMANRVVFLIICIITFGIIINYGINTL